MTPRLTKAGGTRKRPVRYGQGAPTSGARELEAGLRAHKKGRHAEAVAWYRSVVEREPRCVDAWANLGAALVALGRARDAERAFSSAVAAASRDARVLRDAGIGLASLGRWGAARELLEAAVAFDPTLTGAALHLVRVCAEAGDAAAALSHARGAVARAPRAAAAHLELHRALFRDDAPMLAAPAATTALELDPTWDLARLQLGGLLGLAGREDESRGILAGLRASAGQRAALGYALESRRASTRFFAFSRQVLAFALESSPPAGPVLEFGVRHGISTRLLAELGGAHIHAFDSFRGLPEPFYGRAPGAFTTDGELPDIPENVTLHVGLFSETLPRYLELGLPAPRLVHIDSDLYSSAREVLDALSPLLGPGTVLVFDEYLGNDRWQEDEFRAFQEVRVAHGWRYEYLAFNWFTGQAVVRMS
ncbi:MAG: class I SAM-dependent methyltransferase [Myxococcales bacterium]|nr:class I SAM-dependent methyltransferase [Myxococcales bacterium]